MNHRHLHIFSIIFVVLLSCKPSNKSNTSTTNDSIIIKQDTIQAKKGKTVVIDSATNALAQFLAGTYFDTKYFDASLKASFDAHSKVVKTEWANLDNRILSGLDSFVNVKIKPELIDSILLFYPFSGPDFLFANHFYPGHQASVLVALEDVGTIPDLNKLSATELTNYLTTLRNALFTPYKYGFYRTKGMEVDFKNKHLNGTIHHLLLYLAKEGYQVCKVKGCKYDENGSRILSNYDSETKFIYIEYYDPEKEEVRNISYHSMDASNEGLEKKNPNFLTFIENHSQFYVLMKSASYLLQYDMFDKMKQIVKKRAIMVIQDDTGLMYKDIDNDNWDVELYGYYTKTIPLFVQRYQQDLADAYKASGKKPLPFQIGYNIAHGEYQLMIIRKK